MEPSLEMQMGHIAQINSARVAEEEGEERKRKRLIQQAIAANTYLLLQAPTARR
jgi:hypothetical protein